MSSGTHSALLNVTELLKNACMRQCPFVSRLRARRLDELTSDVHDTLQNPKLQAYISHEHAETVAALAAESNSASVLKVAKRKRPAAPGPDTADSEIQQFIKRIELNPLRILRFARISFGACILMFGSWDANATHYIRKSHQSDQNGLAEIVCSSNPARVWC